MAVYGAMPMVPGSSLEDQLRQRQSAQAAQLQPSLPGQSPPQGGGQGGMTFSGVMQQRRQQAQQLQQRQSDIQVGERLMQILDPSLPKPARQFLFKQLSKSIGIDPKGETAKDIGALVSGLDPEALEGVRRQIADKITNAQPGEIVQFARGVLTGQVPVTQLIGGGAPQGGVQGQEAEAGASTNFPGRMSLGGPRPAAGASPDGTPVTRTASPGGVPGSTVGPRDETPPRLSPEAAPTSTIVPQMQHVPPRMQETVPELVDVLGLDNTQRYRNQDIINFGYTGIPSSEAKQRDVAAELRQAQTSVVQTLVMGNQLAEMINGRPEVLNVNLGRIPWLGEVVLPNPASTVAQASSAFEALAKNFGWSGIDVGDGARTRAAAEEVARRWFGDRPERERAANQDAANTNLRVQSILVNMAFAMAAAKGQTGRNLSDRDVEQQLTELGRSANPEQFLSALNANMARLYDQYRTRSQYMVGREVPLITPQLDQGTREVLSEGLITPPRLLETMGAQPVAGPNARRGSMELPWDLSQPYMGARPGDIIQDERGARFRFGEIPEGGRSMPIESITGGLAPDNQSVPRAPARTGPDRPTRASPTLEEEDNAARQRMAEDRALKLNAEVRAERAQQIAESGEARAARNEQRSVERERREQIQQAFAALATAFRGGGGAGVSVGGAAAAGGGDQDVRAFQVQPAPQRRAPTPVNAAPYQLKGQ